MQDYKTNICPNCRKKIKYQTYCNDRLRLGCDEERCYCNDDKCKCVDKEKISDHDFHSGCFENCTHDHSEFICQHRNSELILCGKLKKEHLK